MRSAACRLVCAALLVSPALAAAEAGPTPPAPGRSQADSQIRAPLPLDVAVSVQGHNGRSPIDLSPDGEWLAHTVETDDTVARDSRFYSSTGFPFAEGDSRMEATLTHTRTGETIRLGGPESASWASAWSPDGQRVAFYSDQDGEAGLWIWERESRRTHRVEGLVVRPFFGFEKPRWSADGHYILVKALPRDMSIAEANLLGPQPAAAGTRFPAVEPGEASVLVRAFVPQDGEGQAEEETAPDDPAVRREPVGDVERSLADLVLVDVASSGFERLVERRPVRDYAFSPDGTRVAYSLLKGWEAHSQQTNYDLAVIDASGGDERVLGENVRLGYGIEWSWSPDSSHIAYIPSGQLVLQAADAGGQARMVLLSLAGGDARHLGIGSAPSFDPGEGEQAPLWSQDGATLYGIADGAAWRIDVDSGAAREIGRLDGWRLHDMVAHSDTHTVWDSASGELWAVGRASDGSHAGLVAIDPGGTGARIALQEPKSYSATFNLDASDASGEIVFVSTDQQHLQDVWLYATDTDEARQASFLNPDLQRYELGRAEVLQWRDLDGESLAGALLLPPGYDGSRPLPLVVWVYAGSMGSGYVNRFGFMGSLPAFNMHVLATRGYAVLFPDAPVRVGSPMSDLMRTVMPGVNAAIDAGYADPERLALMGQSYGSYSTLAIITQTRRFKAAVITAAVLHPDLFADYLGDTGYYEQGQGNMGGSIWEYPDRYLDNSPLFLFDRIETPVLIGQGENDGDLVPSDAIFTALERLGKPVEYRLYEGEGHVITSRVNVVDFWRRRLDFLAENLDLTLDDEGRVVPGSQ